MVITVRDKRRKVTRSEKKKTVVAHFPDVYKVSRICEYIFDALLIFFGLEKIQVLI